MTNKIQGSLTSLCIQKINVKCIECIFRHILTIMHIMHYLFLEFFANIFSYMPYRSTLYIIYYYIHIISIQGALTD